MSNIVTYSLIALAVAVALSLLTLWSDRRRLGAVRVPANDRRSHGYLSGCLTVACMASMAYAYALHTGMVFTQEALQKVSFEVRETRPAVHPASAEAQLNYLYGGR